MHESSVVAISPVRSTARISATAKLEIGVHAGLLRRNTSRWIVHEHGI